MVMFFQLRQFRVWLIVQGQDGALLHQVSFEGEGIEGDGLPEIMPDMMKFCGQVYIEFDREVAAVVDQGTPELSAFPPTFIGRVGTENQEHGYREAE
jgi:hypothetical protein